MLELFGVEKLENPARVPGISPGYAGVVRSRKVGKSCLPTVRRHFQASKIISGECEGHFKDWPSGNFLPKNVRNCKILQFLF